MFLGIDVGGTHTDAVLLSLDGASFTVISWTKVDTDHTDVVSSVRSAMDAVLEGQNPALVERFTLSTTLTTNALAQERHGNALLALVPGPGMDIAGWTEGLPVHVLSGAIDHRGRETAPLVAAELEALQKHIQDMGPCSLAIAGKFATRGPEQENALAGKLRSPEVRSVSLSHRLSGMLNFPRRAVTAFYNAALWQLHGDFADAVLRASAGLGNALEPFLLMAHGGSAPLHASRENCVEAASSGPAASVLGILALERHALAGDDAVLFLDIGGSTTDLSVLAHGSPVTAPEGLTLGGRKTSVPGLATASVPVGGDCPLVVGPGGEITLDSRRLGPCLAMGGPAPTLTDALNVLGLAAWGDAALSARGMRDIAARAGAIKGAAVTAETAAAAAVTRAAETIRQAADIFLAEINARPVYTVAQLLAGATVTPKRLCVAGGAGPSMAAALEKAFQLPVAIPGHAAFANAIGAALARVSAFASLYADTARNVAHLLPDGGTREIPSGYGLDQAVKDVAAYLAERMAVLDPQADAVRADLVESDSFTMHDERGTRLGRTIRVLSRVRPGLVTDQGS